LATPPLSSEQSQYILENIRDIVFTLSPDGRIISLTREFENLTGWSREEWIGKHFLDIVHPADTAVVTEGFEATIRGETLPPYHARIFAKSGDILTLEAKPTPQIIDGQVTGYLGIARDITEHVQAEKELRASEQQYRNIINSMGDPIHVIDKDFNIILANPAFSRWLKQLDLDNELVGKTLRETFPFIPDKVTDEYNTIFSNGETLVTEESTTIDGKTYLTETRKIPIIRQEEVVQIVTIIRDITESKKAREDLLESEAKYAAVVENATDGVFILQDWGIKYANKALANISGYSSEELVGMPFLNLLPQELRENVAQRFKLRTSETDLLSTEENKLLCKNGTIKDIEANSRVIQYQQRPAVTGIARDITERKKIEEQLRESEERLRGFMDAATDSFSLWDSELNLVDVNKTGLDTFLAGTDKTEIIGKNILEFHTHPEDIKNYKKVLRTGKPFVADIIAPPQQYGDIVLSVKAFKVGEGLGIITNDITKQKRMEKALRKSEEKLREFRDAATDAFSLWDSELNLIDINETGLGMLPVGTKKKDIIGKNMREFISDEKNITNYKKVLRTGKAFAADRIFHVPILGERIVSVKAFKVEEGLGLISTDISERKKAEEELKKIKMRLEYLLKSCPAVVYSCTPDGHFETTFMSENIKEILGYQAKHFIHKPEFWESNIHPDERGHVISTLGGISEKGYYSEAYRFKHKNGTYRWMLEEANLIHDDNGNPQEIVGFWTDITEHKQTEEALRESEEKFRSIFENSLIGMALTNLDFKFNKVNIAFCQMLKYNETELTQMSFLDITHEEYHDRDKEYAKKLVKGEISSFQTEERYLKKNQDIFWARVVISLLRDEKGNPSNFIVMVEDITSIKQQEDEMKKQLLKYNVEDGNVYLVAEETPTLSQIVFKDIIDVGYKGFVISRTPEREYRAHLEENYDFFWLTEKNSYHNLLTFLERVPHKSVILIDRLEYLFLKEGSENAMLFVYKLRETTYLKNLIIIISIDSATLTEREVHILEKETQPIEPRFMAKIPEEFSEVLRLVYQQNNLGVKPSYSDIGDELQISKPTVRKRIKQLIATGYVIEHKKGKSKILEISGKGRSLFIK